MLTAALVKLEYLQVDAFLRRHGITRSQLEKLHAPEEQFGIVSPYRSNLSKNQNKQRMTALIQDVQALGLSWESAQGIWQEEQATGFSKENSILVHDITFDYLMFLARRYEQDAVVYKPADGPLGLYDLTTGEAVVMTDFEIDTGSPRPRMREEDSDPYTRMRDTELHYEFDWSAPVEFGTSPVYGPAEEQVA